MDEIYLGIIIIVLGVGFIRTLNAYHNYKQTIYPEIYSGFLEFLLRKGHRKRLSESGWFQDNFGKHRIVYESRNTHKTFPQQFIIIILKSGVYLINSKNLNGHIYQDKHQKIKYKTTFVNSQTKRMTDKAIDLPHVIQETENMKKKIEKIIDSPINASYITFLNDSTIEIPTDFSPSLPWLQQKEVFPLIEDSYKTKDSVFTESQIEYMYQKLITSLSQ